MQTMIPKARGDGPRKIFTGTTGAVAIRPSGSNFGQTEDGTKTTSSRLRSARWSRGPGQMEVPKPELCLRCWMGKLRLSNPKRGPSAAFARACGKGPARRVLLKRRVKAKNVVTEHNLDVLAFLNLALRYPGALGPEDAAENERWTKALLSWRNRLREGVFHLLWDDETWHQDLDESRRAFKNMDLGRIVTGGSFELDAASEAPSEFDAVRPRGFVPQRAIRTRGRGRTFTVPLLWCLCAGWGAVPPVTGSSVKTLRGG